MAGLLKPPETFLKQPQRRTQAIILSVRLFKGIYLSYKNFFLYKATPVGLNS